MPRNPAPDPPPGARVTRVNRLAVLAAWCRQHGYPEPVAEHKFSWVRKWRLDFAWPGPKVALELEGLTAAGGRHQRVKGYADDCEKYNAALVLGWRVVRVTTGQFAKGEHQPVLEELLRADA